VFNIQFVKPYVAFAAPGVRAISIHSSATKLTPPTTEDYLHFVSAQSGNSGLVIGPRPAIREPTVSRSEPSSDTHIRRAVEAEQAGKLERLIRYST
jgi:hypothetical protein